MNITNIGNRNINKNNIIIITNYQIATTKETIKYNKIEINELPKNIIKISEYIYINKDYIEQVNIYNNTIDLITDSYNYKIKLKNNIIDINILMNNNIKTNVLL